MLSEIRRATTSCFAAIAVLLCMSMQTANAVTTRYNLIGIPNISGWLNFAGDSNLITDFSISTPWHNFIPGYTTPTVHAPSLLDSRFYIDFTQYPIIQYGQRGTISFTMVLEDYDLQNLQLGHYRTSDILATAAYRQNCDIWFGCNFGFTIWQSTENIGRLVSSVPEPSMAGLLALGLGLFAARKRKLLKSSASE